MSDRASLLWESSSVSDLPNDASFNTVRVTKTNGAITSHLDKTVALVCDGNFSCAGTAWVGTLKTNSKWQVSDWDAKVGHDKKRNVLPGIRQLNIWNYRYKTDPPGSKTIGVMAHELISVFPELVHVPKQPGQYMSVNTDGISAVSLGGIKEVDANLQLVEKKVAVLEYTNDLLRRDLRAQSDRLTEQDDRLRAQNDRMRSFEDMLRTQSDRITKLNPPPI
jgi:hypothetical protein